MMQLVVFSDAECSGCQQFEGRLQTEVLPVFDGHLQVIYKHFPLTSKHPNALQAARALEAARLQDQYFALKDALLERRRELESVDYVALASELGLDAARFERDLHSPEVLRRIQEDMQYGQSLGVTSTPALFLNRRGVDRTTRSAPGFWKLRADALRRVYEDRRLEW